MTAVSPFRLPPPRSGGVDLLIVAGEHSGDEHAARMLREFLALRPGMRVAALGGPCLAAAGAQLLHDLTGSSVVGLVEVVRNLSFFRSLFEETLRWIKTHRPAAVCFVDYPGFNLRLAEALRRRGLSAKGGGTVRTLYYISPQIWAWKAGRRYEMARNLDALAVIFPFELQTYADVRLPVEFVGHPFLAQDYVTSISYDASGPVLLLPGSRKQAVERIFPVLLAGYAQFRREKTDHNAVVLFPSPSIRNILKESLAGAEQVRLQPVGEPVAACAVLTSSGTMSMQCALAGIPGAIAYRANALTYLLGRWLVRVPYLGIANLLLGEAMYPEYIQDRATPESLAGELSECAGSPGRRERAALQAERLRSLLAQPVSGSAGHWLARHL